MGRCGVSGVGSVARPRVYADYHKYKIDGGSNLGTVQSILCTLQLPVSTVVGNKVTTTVAAETTVEKGVSE